MPVLRIQYVAGKLLGIMLAILMQMVAVIIASDILYQVKWGNLFEILLVTIVYSFAIGSIVLLWGLLQKPRDRLKHGGSHFIRIQFFRRKLYRKRRLA